MKYIVVRDETPGANLTGEKPWIDARNDQLGAYMLTRVSDDQRFLLIGATTDEQQARAWADSQLGQDCACGHHSHLHASDPTHSGNTPCRESLDGKTDKHGYPINPCPCREYTPKDPCE